MNGQERYEHGTMSRFRKGCKCEPCRAAKRAVTNAYRARRRADKTPAGGGPIGPADVTTCGNPAWRPAHYPPPCEACGGFGYTRPSWSACRACKTSPGHAMTFNQWTELR